MSSVRNLPLLLKGGEGRGEEGAAPPTVARTIWYDPLTQPSPPEAGGEGL
jgi:hypothetical protein